MDNNASIDRTPPGSFAPSELPAAVPTLVARPPPHLEGQQQTLLRDFEIHRLCRGLHRQQVLATATVMLAVATVFDSPAWQTISSFAVAVSHC